MTVLIPDPDLAARIKAEREASDAGSHDEVWDGVYVVSPIANNFHQWLVVELCYVLRSVVDTDAGDRIYAGINVSDRVEGWVENYRVPDVAVVLRGNPAKDCETHLCGGPDFLVEILSPNDKAREKLPFYASIGVHEVLIVDRDPWALELYRLKGGTLELVGTSAPDREDILMSAAFPITFRLVPGKDRPMIEASVAVGTQTWRI